MCSTHRICPGLHFAEASLFLAMASVLSTFNISKALDQQGREITPLEVFNSAMIMYVVPLPVPLIHFS